MKKPITQFTFQDAEYIVTKVADLVNKLIVLVSGFINGFKNGEAYAKEEE